MFILKIYFYFIGVYLKSRIQYRFTFVLNIFIQFFTHIANFFLVYFLVNRFNNVMNWGFYEIVFLYAFNLFSFGVSGLFFFGPALFTPQSIRKGNFDITLIRPINNLLFNILLYFREVFFGHITLATLMFVVSINKLSIDMSLLKLSLLFIDLVGATLIQSSILIIITALSIVTVKTNNILNTFIWYIRKYLDYPIIIYDKVIQIILIYILPLAFINFFPSLKYLSGVDNGSYPVLLSYISPVIGLGLFIFSIFFWKIMLRSYQSTGS
jgi:ABC-2 type transport system permease protein